MAKRSVYSKSRTFAAITHSPTNQAHWIRRIFFFCFFLSFFLCELESFGESQQCFYASDMPLNLCLSIYFWARLHSEVSLDCCFVFLSLFNCCLWLLGYGKVSGSLRCIMPSICIYQRRQEAISIRLENTLPFAFSILLWKYGVFRTSMTFYAIFIRLTCLYICPTNCFHRLVFGKHKIAGTLNE